MLVAVRDDTIHEHPCQHGHAEREKLEEQRQDAEAPYVSRMPHKVLHVPPDDTPSVSDRLEVIGWLKRQGHTRKRAAELLHRHPPPSTRRIHDLDTIFAPALKDHKMGEFPMQDASLVHVWQRLQLKPHAAATQAVPPCRLHECPGTHPVAVRASHVAHVAQWYMLAMKR